jgi:hypothetical protein
MLSKEQIEYLLDKKILIKIDSFHLIKNRCYFTRPEIHYQYDINNSFEVFLFANPTNDISIDEFINEENLNLIKETEQDISKQIETNIKLTLPGKESRLRILENEFIDYIEKTKSHFFDWEFNDLFSDVWQNKKTTFLRSAIDNLLIFDDKINELRISNFMTEGFLIPSKSFDRYNYFNQLIISKTKIEWLRNEIEKERERLNLNQSGPILNTPESSTITTPNNKIKWTGQKNQLYSVIRQLKIDHELIKNSFNELAEFIISNFTGFENTKKETVEKELKKNSQLPKNKRIKIEPTKED